ncbi:glycosyltransferase family 4 protein [Desulfobacterota bacterium M19]
MNKKIKNVPLKILIMHHGGESLLGSERSLLALLDGLNKQYFTISLLCNSKTLEQEALKRGFNVINFRFPQITIEGKETRLEFVQYFIQLVKLYCIAKRLRPDIIYSNSGLPTQIGYPVAKALNLPILTHIRASHSLRYPWMWLFKFSDVVVFVSRTIMFELTNKVNFSGKIKVVYNGIDIKNHFPPPHTKNNTLRKSLGISARDIVIGQVGSLISRKGGDILIRAFIKVFQKRKNIFLVFIGKGEKHQEWNNLACEFGVTDKIIFLGEQSEVAAFYNNLIDINVNSSRSEAFGRTLIEASACGLPSVGSRTGGIQEIIVDGETGYLFKEDNSDDLANKLMRLIDNAKLRNTMGQNAMKRTNELFSLDKYIESMTTILQDTAQWE